MLNAPVVFVLSGGGNLGAAQVGMLRALLENDIYPDMILGCSAGAINGAALAVKPTAEGVAQLAEIWCGLDGRHLMPRTWLPRLVALARPGEAIHKNRGLRRLLETGLADLRFEDLPIRFECVATDITRFRQVWFNRGPLIDAVLASSAIPALYPAVRINGSRYLDGAIVDDVPVRRAVELGAATIFVLEVGALSQPRLEPRRPLDVALHAHWIARKHRFQRELEAIPPDIELHLLPHGPVPTMRYDDFTHSARLIEAAYHASATHLDRRLPRPTSVASAQVVETDIAQRVVS